MTIQINGTSGISGVDGSAATPSLQGSDTNTGVFFGTDEVKISTGGTERAKVDGSGYLRFASGTGGVQFNGDTAAANALDDYEEGTWSPILTFGTYNLSPQAGADYVAQYAKIGKLVCFNLYNRWNLSTWTGTFSGATVSLPFTVAQYGAISLSYWSDFLNIGTVSLGYNPHGYVDKVSSTVRLTFQAGSQAGESPITHNSLGTSSSGGLMIVGHYLTT